MGKVKITKKTLWQAIIKMCIQCMGGNYWKDIRECSDETCPLRPYRPGGNLNPYSQKSHTRQDNVLGENLLETKKVEVRELP